MFLTMCIGSAAPCVAHCSCIIHVLCEFCFLDICVVDFFFPLCACLHKLYILPILYVSICTCVWLCTRAQAPRSLFADGREGWRLTRCVWASSSGHLITAPAPAACLRLPRPPCLGASFLTESDDALPSSPKCRSLEGPTLAQSTAVSD